MMIVHMVGNAHIDPVWLWPWQAGVDEALATLRTAADLCDEYPDFTFTCSDAWLFAQAERLRPALFARITRLVAAGRWSLVGGTWLQPDLNLPTRESLRRQITYGQAWFHGRFGIRPAIGWNVDSFGQPAFLPDLLAAHGYTAYVFGRPVPRELGLPATAFLWRGQGGAELPAFRIVPGYGFAAPDLRPHIAAAIAAADPALGHTMCFYGVSDHGGGPTRAQLDWIRANRHAIPGAELRLSTPAAFFAAIAGRPLPTVAGELQHCFIGCYSVMGDIKRAQRATEHRLEQAAAAIALAPAPDRPGYRARLDAAWPDALFTAFHDILAGTAAPAAWPDCRAMQGRARLAAEEVLLDATRRWSATLPPAPHQRILAVNTADTPFDGLVDCETWLDHELWGSRHLALPDGTPIPFQQTQPGAMFRVPRLLFPLRIPPRGTAAVQLVPGPAPLPPQPGRLEATPARLANDRLALTLGPAGIAAIALDGTPVIENLTLLLREDPTDSWGTGIDRFAGPEQARLAGAAWVVEEQGPLRASLRLEHRIGTSRLRWTLFLVRGETRLSMLLEINFDERYRLLQLAVPPSAPLLHRADAVAGGTLARPSGPEEYPFHGWTRAACPAAQLALVTHDAFSLGGAPWHLTLLRSPRMAWPGLDSPVHLGRDHFTDQGVHQFAIELHADTTLSDARLDAAACRLAHPIVTFDTTEGIPRPLASDVTA
jgi:alpha-mannosidase